MKRITQVTVSTVFRSLSFAVVLFLPAFIGTANPQPGCRLLLDGVSAWFPGEDARDAFGSEPGTWIGDAKTTPGRWGNAFEFDGVHDALAVPGSPGLDLRNLTVECWLRRGTTDRVGNDGVAVLMGGNAGAWVFGIAQEGGLFLGKVGVVNSPARGAILDTDWHHAAVTREGSEVRFYVDGVSVGDAVLEDLFLPSEQYGIGGLSRPFDSLSYSFQGLIDDMTVYRRALSPAEVASLARNVTAPRCLDDVQLALIRSPRQVSQGSEYAIAAEVRNHSAHIAGPLRVRAPVPTGIEFLAANASQGSASVAGGEVVFELGALDPGASAQITLRWRVGATVTGSVNHRLSLDLTAVDAVAANNEWTVSYVATGGCVPAFADLQSWWRADGSAQDTVSGGDGAASPSVRYLPGKVGTAFALRENHSAVSVTQAVTAGADDFTIECWIRRESDQVVSPTPNHCFLVGGSGEAMGFGLVPDGRLYIYTPPLDSVFSGRAITDTEWHHVGVTKSGSDVRFYIDGQPAGSAAYGTRFRPGPSLTLGGLVGADPGNSYSFFGDLDELAIYSRALSSEEFSLVAEAGSAGRCHQDLRLTPVAIPEQAVVDDTVQLAFLAEQIGSLASGEVRFVTALPPGVEFVSGTSDQGLVSETAGVVRSDLGTLTPGIPVRIQLRLRFRALREYRFDARLQSASPEISDENNIVPIRINATDFQIAVEPVLTAEGPSGVTNLFAFRIRLNVARPEPVRLAYATEDGTALARQDYLAESGEVLIASGSTQAVIQVPVLGDGTFEASEDFRIRVSILSPDPVRTATGTAVIQNDDPPPILQVLPARWMEGASGTQDVGFDAQVFGDTDLPVRFQYQLESLDARAGTDFAAGSGSLEVPVGATQVRIPVAIFGDTVFEGDERLLLRIMSAENCRVAATEVRGLIVDDDPPDNVPSRFTVSSVGTDLEPGRPFPIIVTALNARGEVLAGFDGAVTVTARRGSGIPTGVVVSEVMAAAEQGGDFVELLNASPSGIRLDGWRVLLFGPSTWPEPTVILTLRPPQELAPGQVLVLTDFFTERPPQFDAETFSTDLWSGGMFEGFPGEPLIGVLLQDPTGFTEDSLLAGRAWPEFLSLTAGASGPRWEGDPVVLAAGPPYRFQRIGSSNLRGAASWTVPFFSNPGALGIGLNSLFDDALPVALTPGVLLGFSEGQWIGDLVLPEPVAAVAFRVDDGNGHTGRSGFFSSRSDLDEDGLPDAWEIEHGFSYRDPKDAAADADGDGYTNLQEWVAGTDPRSRSSALRLSIRGSRLEWVAAAGRRYRLEQRDLEALGDWVLVKEWEPGPGGPVSEVLGVESIAEGLLFRLRVDVP